MQQSFSSLVGHCKKIWSDKGCESLQVGVHTVIDGQQTIAQRSGDSVSSTCCVLIEYLIKEFLISAFFDNIRLFPEINRLENEIEFHIHALYQEITKSHTRLFYFIQPDAQHLINQGFKPVTSMTGHWINTILSFEPLGFKVDNSVYNLKLLKAQFSVNRSCSLCKNL